MPSERETIDTDLVVIGSGAAGLTAALTAALSGLDCIVLEHEAAIGGTTARSSGTVWVPDNHLMRRHGMRDDAEKAECYLKALVGDGQDPALWQTYLKQAPAMLADLERSAGIGFRPYLTAPDYRQDLPGAASGGRPVEPLPFDGHLLGKDFSRIAWPLRELMLFGGMMVTRGEALELLRADRSPAALWLGVRLVARYLIDRLRYRRGTRLVLGNALVARLFKAISERRVPVWTDTRARRLVRNGGRVSGVVVECEGREVTVSARMGVVLAGGGFPANARWREENLPSPVGEYTPAAKGCDGSTLELGLDAGAALAEKGFDNALWFPSSIAERSDGTTSVYPHIVLDRSKPGLIAVDGTGRRFTNEAVSYHEFVRAMYRAHKTAACIPAWLICDRAFIRRYGLGLIRPRTPRIRKYVESGYLLEASTIADLAQKAGIPPEALQATVAGFNRFCEDGIDRDFHKGETIYDRSNGDPSVAPNPCLGPIGNAPFYALAVWPTPLGTSRGLKADPYARACDASGNPVPGLYVCGNDMQSAFGGEYPGAGAQIGLAMTFGWIAARHAAGVASADDSDAEPKRQHKQTA